MFTGLCDPKGNRIPKSTTMNWIYLLPIPSFLFMIMVWAMQIRANKKPRI